MSGGLSQGAGQDLQTARRWNRNLAVPAAFHCRDTLKLGDTIIETAIVLMITVLCAYLTGEAAMRRGHKVKAWYWMGAIFGPFALIAVYLLPRPQNKATA